VPLSCVVGEPVMPRHFEDSLDEIVEWLP
jgi:hypothetical protein